MVNVIVEIFKTLLEILKLGKLPVFVLAVLGWILLLLPQYIKHFMSIEEILHKYRSYIGLCTVIFSVFILSILFYEWAERVIKNIRIKKIIINRLKNLCNDEKVILAQYIRERNRTQYYSITNGVANGLETKHILYRASTLGSGPDNFPYNIQDIAYDHLIKHNNLLELDAEAQEDISQQPDPW